MNFLHFLTSITLITGLSTDQSIDPLCNGTICSCNDQTVDCSNSKILNPTDLIKFLENSPQKTKHKYRKLVLARNRIGYISRFFIENVFKGDIVEYDFSLNEMSNMEPNVFDTAVSLRDLNLANNKLGYVNKAWFTGLGLSLESLNLSYNRITWLGGRSFDPLTNMWKLDLSGNPISSFQKSCFWGLKFLAFLYLSDCNITYIADDTFSGLNNLQAIDLSYNKLIGVPWINPSLLRLNLNANAFTTLHEYTFSTFRKLTDLYASYMPNLTLVEKCAFCGLAQINRLFVSNCPRLTRVSQSAFGSESPQNLEMLDFSQNNLSTLSAIMVDWKKMNIIQLDGNPWNCDCNFSWIASSNKALRKNGYASCSRPKTLAGRPLNRLTKSDFAATCRSKSSTKLGSSLKTPKLLISLIAVALLSAGLLIAWYVCMNRRTLLTVSEMQKSKSAGRGRSQPYAYRNLAMMQERQERIERPTDMDIDEDVIIMNPIFETLEKPSLI